VIPDVAWELLPVGYPLDMPRWIEGLAKAAEFGERESRAYAWAMHLIARLSYQAITTAVMGIVNARPWPMRIQDISAGFIPYQPKREGTAQSLREARMQWTKRSIDAGGTNYSFGVVLGISVAGRDFEPKRIVEFSSSQIVDIDEFPVVVEFRQIVNSSPPHPSGATSACYAQPRRSKRFFGPVWSDGIVIARHVLAALGFSTGVSVPMVSGSSFAVVDIDSRELGSDQDNSLKF
jgi:hypothetical protein